MDFYQTVMGRRFYEDTMPQIARALTMIATELKKSNEPAIIEGSGFTGDELHEALKKGHSGINMNDLIKDLKKFEYEDVCRLALIDMCKMICDLPFNQIIDECKARHDSAFSIEELVDIQTIFNGFGEVLEKYLSAAKANDMEENHGES